ncbi:C1 family peptidase [Kordia sp.]|uniref:C1 family peptidase n=1 Tax=Kordia sp. TaxID=1965332 RepID=UPI003D6B3481
MKALSFCILFLSVNCLWSQITLKKVEKLPETIIHISSQTPVQDQGQRNTCSAFGVAAALEVLPNMPKNISEMYLYGVQKARDFSNNIAIEEGQFLKEYISSLNKYGILTETQLPYPKELPQKWYKTDIELRKVMVEGGIGPVRLLVDYKPKALKIFVTDYEYLDGTKSKNITRIKRLLNSGVKAIPVSYQLYLPAWEKFQSKEYTTITPDAGYGILLENGTYANYSDIKKEYPDINKKINSKKVTLGRIDKRANGGLYGGHVVTIVGYDSEGFIIKNSWGTDWRYYGYERVSYDFHELFAYEALAIKKVTYKK